MLGQIRGAITGPDSLIYVLDRYWAKIVAFRPDGSVERVILGGEGEGPGEFVTPIHLTTTDEGFSVLDYQLHRVTEFSWSGDVEAIHRMQSRSPWRHLIHGDTVWIAYSSGGPSNDPIFYRLLSSGEPLDSGPPLPDEDRPFGTTVGLARGPAGAVLITSARPGVWISHAGESWSRRGHPLYPETEPPLLDRIGAQQLRLTPAQHTAAGLGVIGDSIVLQGIQWYARPFDWDDPPARDELHHAVGVFRVTGEHLATIQLPDGISSAYLYSDPASGRILLDTVDPYPQVVEYELVACSVDANRP